MYVAPQVGAVMNQGFGWLESELRARFPIDDELKRWLAIATAGRYAAMLARIHGFVAPLEHAFDRTPGLDALVDLRKRAKTRLLASDLATLGISSTARSTPPACAEIPTFTELLTALGWMVVVERSTLSHDLIFRQLAGPIPGPMAFASAYLKCYLGHAQARWHELGEAIERTAQTQEHGAQLLGAASDAVGCYRRWTDAT